MSNPPRFNVGDMAPGKNEIKYIYGQTDTILVYLCTTGSIGHFIDLDEVTSKIATALRIFERVRALGFNVYPKQDWPAVRDELGFCFFNSLTAVDEATASASFAAFEERVMARAGNTTRIHYLSAAAAATAVLAVWAYFFYEFYWTQELRIYGACAFFAALGAAASVILRLPSVLVDPFEHRWVTQYRGASRIVVGVIFSAFWIVAAKANLVAGFATGTVAAMLAYSFLCGFSERFAPELLAGLEKDSAGSKRKPLKE